LRVEGLGFRDKDFACDVLLVPNDQDHSGFDVQGSGFRVQGSGFRVQGSGFRVQGVGWRIALATCDAYLTGIIDPEPKRCRWSVQHFGWSVLGREWGFLGDVSSRF